MKITKVLLRWYKSFNVNYMGYIDRRDDVLSRPWNCFKDNEQNHVIEYPFIEIPIEEDITTIVGANESGKSHLLSAIYKVLTGYDWNDDSQFDRTDLCYYSPVRNQNVNLWPYIGLQFTFTKNEIAKINEFLSKEQISIKVTAKQTTLTLILGQQNNKVAADLYIGDKHIELSKESLSNFRKLLPDIKFIHSDIPISDSIDIRSLVYKYDAKNEEENNYFYNYDIAQGVAKKIAKLSLPLINQTVTDDFLNQLQNLKDQLSDKSNEKRESVQLEFLLFRDVLNISRETLEVISSLRDSDRGYIESYISTWNREIERKLNLSQYWQQDEFFSLQVNYKRGIIYFEITDRTGSVYTFKERSSGLKYFLSYYIQAKALGNTKEDQDSIILMDEPDSFLSILGQRNLLLIFESLISPELSKQKRQLIYTTHSPFLINRNFPRRIRLVRKGHAEEGTQFIPEGRIRRYEPVRSALGVDCAQTLFMGATNLVLEGATDQFLISELIRTFISTINASDFLNLNSIVLTSAESAPAVEKLVASSQWGDEVNPAIVVLLDGDKAGEDVRKRLTGKARKAKKLLEEEFVVTINEAILDYEEHHKVVTTEDILPLSLYKQSVISYLAKWYPDLANKEKSKKIKEIIDDPNFGKDGVVEGTRNLFSTLIFEENRDYDKLGVLQEAISILQKDFDREKFEDLSKRTSKLCQFLMTRLYSAETSLLRESGSRSIERLIGDSQKKFRESISVYDLLLLIQRLEREAEFLGVDGDDLRNKLRILKIKVEDIRKSEQQRIVDKQWTYWNNVLESIRKNPLEPILPEEKTYNDYISLEDSSVDSDLDCVTENEDKSQEMVDINPLNASDLDS
jgi:predicted ATP-dependent endonuclease of OLD family